MPNKIYPVRETTDEARMLAAKLVEENRYGALGVREPGTDIALVSRVAVAWSPETGLFFSASDLSVHSRCLNEYPECSIMLGEVGKGEGLAHPRITVAGEAMRLANNHVEASRLRAVFLSAHPKATLYVDFTDFGFYSLLARRAFLNAGFGKAFHLEEKDLLFLASCLK